MEFLHSSMMEWWNSDIALWWNTELLHRRKHWIVSKNKRSLLLCKSHLRNVPPRGSPIPYTVDFHNASSVDIVRPSCWVNTLYKSHQTPFWRHERTWILPNCLHGAISAIVVRSTLAGIRWERNLAFRNALYGSIFKKSCQKQRGCTVCVIFYRNLTV